MTWSTVLSLMCISVLVADVYQMWAHRKDLRAHTAALNAARRPGPRRRLFP